MLIFFISFWVYYRRKPCQLKNKGYDYLCVSSKQLKDYVAVKKDNQPVLVTDKRDNPIELLLITNEGIDDSLLYVHSDKKATKELSMHIHQPMQDKARSKIRKCSKPEAKAIEYIRHWVKQQPWVNKSVLPEKQNLKNDPPENRDT